MNKKLFRVFYTLFILLTLLFVCVGCADNSAEDSDEVIFIDLNRESASSRGIESWNENLYPPENLYWTYTAKKIRGNYTTGQTLTEQAVVKNGPATGLGTVGPFSVGVWEFKLYGYLSCAEDPSTGELEFTDLVYTGKTGTETNNYITIDKRPEGTSGVQEIIFELSTDEARTFWDSLEGQLAIRNMHLTVPENQRFTIDSATTPPVKTFVKTTVSIVSVPTDAKAGGTAITAPFVLAESLTEITEEKVSGADVALDGFGAFKTTGASNEFTPGRYEFEFKAEYKDVFTTDTTDAPQYAPDGWAQIGKISTYPIEIKAGVKTTLSGDINDIEVKEDEYAHDVKYDWAVAKITWKSVDDNPDDTGLNYSIYTSLKEAVTAYITNTGEVSTTNKYVELIHDLDIAETVTVSADVPVYLNNHFAENITISGAGSLTFKMATDNSRDYKVSGNGFVVNNIKPEKTGSDKYVWLTTTGTGTVEVTASADTVYHTGSAGTVKVVACKYANTDRTKGYHLGTDKDGAATVTKVGTVDLTAGNLEIGGCTTVESLLVKGTGVKLWGKRNSVVNAYNYNGMGTVLKAKNTAQAVFDASQSNAKQAFTEVVLDGNNGGRTSGGKEKQYLYGIEGMEIQLPATYPFKYGDHNQRCWNTEADNSGLMCEDRYVVGSSADNILYGVWNMLPIGGPIYYITPNTKPDGTNPSDTITGGENGEIRFGDVIYRFYDKNGVAVAIKGLKYQRTKDNEIAEAGLTNKLTEAVYYTVLGAPTEDKFYAVEMTNGRIGAVNPNVFSEISASCLGVGYGGYGTLIDGKLGSVSTLAASDCVGQGKKITKAILATKGTSGGVFEKLISMEGTLGPVGSDVHGLGNNTLWAYIDFLNNGTEYPVAGYEGTYVVWGGEYGTKKAKSKPYGIDDWFVPGVLDFNMVGVWCGAAKYNSTATFNFSAATNVPANPIKREVYDMFIDTHFRCATETSTNYTPYWSKNSGWNPNGIRNYSNCSMFAVRGF